MKIDIFCINVLGKQAPEDPVGGFQACLARVAPCMSQHPETPRPECVGCTCKNSMCGMNMAHSSKQFGVQTRFTWQWVWYTRAAQICNTLELG